MSNREIGALFGAGHRLVGDAMRGGAGKWKVMLGTTDAGDAREDLVTSLAIVAEPVVKQATLTGFKYKAWSGDGDWIEVAGRTIDAVVAALEAGGWRLACMAKTSGREPFAGTYEIYFKR